MTPQIAFRANGGAAVGLGHLRRCLTLAQALQRRGAGVLFIVNDDDPRSAALLEAGGVDVAEVPAAEIHNLSLTRRQIEARRADALVVDSYDVTPQGLSAVTVPVAAIVDAPPPAPLPVRMLTNAAADARSRACPADPATRVLLGPEYVLLREEFQTPGREVVRTGIERVLISTGGSDPHGWTLRLMRVVHRAVPGASLDVVVGPYFSPALEHELDGHAADLSATLHRNPANMRALMAAADLAVTSGGQTVYELAATGTPTVALRFADNQRVNLDGLAARGALIDAGAIDDAGIEETLSAHLAALAAAPDMRQRLAAAARQAVDGRGAERVADELLALVGRAGA